MIWPSAPDREVRAARPRRNGAVLAFALTFLLGVPASAQTNRPAAQYHVYAGNTHSHTQFTWSHGEQWQHSDCAGILVYRPQPDDAFVSLWNKGYVYKNCPAIYVFDGWQSPAPDMVLRPDWQTVQGLPARHYQVAKQDGFDFYVTSDHSQEAVFAPGTADNPAWKLSKAQAGSATGSDFVALAGFEFSANNNGPGGMGHINVINSEGMLNALVPGSGIADLYRWLPTARPNGSGPVVASFNHPGPHQYDDWGGRTESVTGIITMLEVINHNDHIHYQAFVNALDKGWKVSPVSGLDNHGLSALAKDKSRTFVLATAKTKLAILDAMKHRRTYASLDQNMQCRYSVNGRIMGSTLDRPSTLHFSIHISDPDVGNPGDKITKIDIVREGGQIAQSYTPSTPGYDITWTPSLSDTHSKYFFVRVWNAAGGDGTHPNPSQPVAWLAPVWTGR